MNEQNISIRNEQKAILFLEPSMMYLKILIFDAFLMQIVLLLNSTG